MKQIETFLKKFPDLTESQLITDEMMEQIEGGTEKRKCKCSRKTADKEDCSKSCVLGCSPHCKPGCVGNQKEQSLR